MKGRKERIREATVSLSVVETMLRRILLERKRQFVLLVFSVETC